MILQKKNYGFTLVELLITMAILAIIGTIGAVYFLGNVSESRDAKRISDLETIEKNINIFFTQKSIYPTPDTPIDMTYSGATVWKQGVFGKGANINLGVFGEGYPRDPYYDVDYTYSTTNNAKEFQLGAIMENVGPLQGSEAVLSYIVPRAEAFGIKNAYTLGNYNGFMIKAQTGGLDYYIASPSIMTYDLDDTDIISTIENQKLVFNDFFNLPASYGNSIGDLAGGFQFDPSNPLLFAGDSAQIKNSDSLNSFSQNLKFTYSILPIETFPKYQDMIQSEGNAKLKRLLTKNFNVLFRNYANCLDIKLDGADTQGSGIYTIDADGSGPETPYDVYCDMETDGGGWTRVGDNHITNGTFPGGANIPSMYGSNDTNTIVPIVSPVSSGYAIHQTGTPDSEYEIHFDDFSQVKLGYEIRMSLWQADAIGGGFPTALDYNSEPGYLFTNRVFYSDGTNSINGPLETLQTEVLGGKIWRYQRVRQPILKNPEDFAWYIGYDTETNTDLYFTGVRLELFYR